MFDKEIILEEQLAARDLFQCSRTRELSANVGTLEVQAFKGRSEQGQGQPSAGYDGQWLTAVDDLRAVGWNVRRCGRSAAGFADPVLNGTETPRSCMVPSDAGHEFFVQLTREPHPQL